MVNHSGLLYTVVGVGGSILSVLRVFLFRRQQADQVECSCSGWLDVVSSVPQGSVLGPHLFLLYVVILFGIVWSKVSGYTDDVFSVATVNRPGCRVDVVDLIEDDLHSISSWCHRWGMILDTRKSKMMIVGPLRTLDPPYPMITLDRSELVNADEISVLGVVIDAKLTYEKHVRTVASSCRRNLCKAKSGKNVDCLTIHICSLNMYQYLGVAVFKVLFSGMCFCNNHAS